VSLLSKIAFIQRPDFDFKEIFLSLELDSENLDMFVSSINVDYESSFSELKVGKWGFKI